MSRASAIFGFLLGLAGVVMALTSQGVPAWTVAPAGLLLVVSGLAFRGSHLAQGVMSLLGLGALAGALVVFLGGADPWPCLPYILLGSITMGLGVLGILLDRFQGPGREEDGGL